MYQNKILLNMIIHDMRSPTFSIKIGLEQVNMRLLENKKMRKWWDEYDESNCRLKENLTNICKNLESENEYLDHQKKI